MVSANNLLLVLHFFSMLDSMTYIGFDALIKFSRACQLKRNLVSLNSLKAKELIF